MQRSFDARLRALEKLEAVAERNDLTRYSEHDLYSTAAQLLRYRVFWKLGESYAPHIGTWKPNAQEMARYGEQCAIIGFDEWDYSLIWALCHWLNARDTDERAAALDWHTRWWAATERLTDAELTIICDEPDSDAAQALLGSLYEEANGGG